MHSVSLVHAFGYSECVLPFKRIVTKECCTVREKFYSEHSDSYLLLTGVVMVKGVTMFYHISCISQINDWVNDATSRFVYAKDNAWEYLECITEIYITVIFMTLRRIT